MSDFIIFAPGEQVKEYDVEIFDDEKVEMPLEMFHIVLTLLPGQESTIDVSLSRAMASIFIRDTNSRGLHNHRYHTISLWCRYEPVMVHYSCSCVSSTGSDQCSH